MNHPFRLIPWDLPFLDHLRDEVLRATDNQPGRAIVVFPHNRPKRYLLPLFHRPGTACLPPRLLTVSELMSAFRRDRDATAPTPPPVRREAGSLDQAALLHACVLHLRKTDSSFRERLNELSQLDEALFFPWGVRLAGIFEECFSGGLTPDDLEHTEGEVADFAASLLGALGRLFRLYRESLDSHGLTTPALEAFAATENLTNDTPLPTFLRDRVVVLAGFNAHNGTEDLLFRYLWGHGALICLHGHPDLEHKQQDQQGGRNGLRPAGCGPLADWIADWQAPCELVAAPSGRTPVMHFFAGHDLHSQIAALRDDLDTIPGLFTPTVAPNPAHDNKDADEIPSLAVALTHADALLPVLHHLPARNCNVSLGYPLDRALLSGFISTVLELRATRPENFSEPDEPLEANQTMLTKVHWRMWSALLRHPCLRMLHPDGKELRQALRSLEQQTRQGSRFLAPREHLPAVQGVVSPETAALLDQIVTRTVDDFSAVSTTADLAEALASLCQMLLERGEHLWPRFPLDAECLFRLMRHVVPALRHNLLAHRPLPWPLLESMLRSLLEAERVPFEADPLTGVQVLGMLETRLLHFERVFLLDATEEHLPGPPDHNPLLPDSLRRVLGLPGTRQREELAAYTFHRLVAGAEHVFLYWQEDEAGTQRSRLVEDGIWREEQRAGRLFTPGEAPLRAPRLRVTPPSRRPRPVLRTPEINAHMDALLNRPLSATALDAYLACPLRFYYERLCRIRQLEEVNEGDDAPGVGILLHETLCEFYKPYLGRVYRPNPDAPEIHPDRLVQIFQDKLALSGLAATLPPESGAMLRIAGPVRLRDFLKNQPPEPLILHTEYTATAKYPVGHRDFTLTGIFDRVDARATPDTDSEDPDSPLREVHILDYKTGTVRLPKASFWANTDLFAALAEAITDPRSPAFGDELFPQLAAALPSLQLPLYLVLYHAATGQVAHNAAGVELADSGLERPLFPEGMAEKDRATARKFAVPALLGYVLRHLAECDAFFPREDRHCDWCSVNKLCKI